MNTLISTAEWRVGKALTPIADGVLEEWAESKNLGLNFEALRMELLLVKATLETAHSKHVAGQTAEELLMRMLDSMTSAEDLLEEIDYFRIQDQLHNTYDAADDLALSARHTASTVLGLSSAAATVAQPGQVVEDARQRIECCAWPRAQSVHGNSSSAPSANQPDEQIVSRCLRILHKLLPRSSAPNVHDENSGGESTISGPPHAEETPMLWFNRVEVSQRLRHIVLQLGPMRRDFTTILQSCDRITVSYIAQSRPITTSQSVEPKLYGRDQVMTSIIHDMIKGKYGSKDLTVLPIVGPGGIGKTTMIQHIYRNQEVQNHFQVVIWVCVSLEFNLNKLLEEIKSSIHVIEGEKGRRAEELIEQRLKSKRFLLVLDDIWEISNEDDWKRLLLPLRISQEKGSVILVTTRFPAIAKMVGTADHIELEGLESAEFRKLFLAFVFGDEQYRSDHIDHIFLLETGDKIMAKLKGSPLAAKTACRLLREDLNLHHWRRVLESKEWKAQTGYNDIMPALKLSYDHLPFYQQQCFSYSALFPEDFLFSSSQLINLWLGLDILPRRWSHQTLEDTGSSILNDLVSHGFFREEEINGRPCYVMHDLLHDLALKVASHEILTLRLSTAGSVDIHPSIRHLSIIIDDNAVSGVNFMTILRKLKTRLKVDHLQTLMLFGEVDESLANIFHDLFREASSLRVLHLLEMSYPVESMLPNFSTLLHLRYLFLGTRNRRLMHKFLCQGTEYESQMHLPHCISRFYGLRILDLGSWYGNCDFSSYMSNLTKLCRFYTPKDELHSAICNVGNLGVVKVLKVFCVNKESEGFEPKQLEHLTELTELGIYNLENVHTKEEAFTAKLIEKSYLEKLTLEWDNNRDNAEPDVEAVVLESLQPHRYLNELCIRGHGGPSCPTWLGDMVAVETLCLVAVSWEVLPSLGKMWSLSKLILKHIATVKEFVIEQRICFLIWLELVGLESFEKWVPSQDAPMLPLLQVLIIRDCPKLSELPFSNHILYPPEQHGNMNIDWFPKLKELEIEKCPELLPLPPIPWTETLCSVSIRGVMLLEKLVYSNSLHGVRLDIVGKDDLHSLDQVLAFNNLTALEELALMKCPPLKLRHIVMLSSLKTLIAESSDALVEPLGGQGDVEWQLPIEHIEVMELYGYSGKELTKLLAHLPRLSKLEITECRKITHLAVGVDMQQTMSVASEVQKDKILAAAATERKKEDDGLLLLPAHLSNTLRELIISHCPDLVLVAPPILLPDGGGFQALHSLQRLKLKKIPKLLSAYFFCSPSCHLFPSSLQFLELNGLEGMRTVEPLSNLTSLTLLELRNCGEDLRCKGLVPLLTSGGQLRALNVHGSPRFFAGCDPNPRRVLQDEGGEQQMQLVSPPSSSKLQKLWTDDVAGLLAMPICSLLSSSLNQLQLSGTKEMEHFSKEQEDALRLLTSLMELEFFGFDELQHLPAGLHNLNLIELHVSSCPSVRSLPKDGLPNFLQKLDVWDCGNEELIHQCRGLMGILPKIRLEFSD